MLSEDEALKELNTQHQQQRSRRWLPNAHNLEERHVELLIYSQDAFIDPDALSH